MFFISLYAVSFFILLTFASPYNETGIDCLITLPNLGNRSQNTQIYPELKNCDNETHECIIENGDEYYLEVAMNQICEAWHTSEFSILGKPVSVQFHDDPFWEKLESKCIGLETEPWYGAGGMQRGIDMQPMDRFKMRCDNGVINADVRAARQVFKRNQGHPAEKLKLFHAAFSGITEIRCSPCIPEEEKWADKKMIFGQGHGGTKNIFVNFTEPAIYLSPGSYFGDYTSHIGFPVPVIYDTDGGCPDDVVRLVGTTIDMGNGNNAPDYPRTFPQMYNGQGTCLSLDFSPQGTSPSATNKGLTVYNIKENKLILFNDHGNTLIVFWGDYTPTITGDQLSSDDNQALFAITSVEKIECGGCPSNIQTN